MPYSIPYDEWNGQGFRYENSPLNPDLRDPATAKRMLNKDNGRQYYLMGNISIETNSSNGKLMYAGARNHVSTEWRIGLHAMHGYESETYLGHYVGRMQ